MVVVCRSEGTKADDLGSKEDKEAGVYRWGVPARSVPTVIFQS